MAPPIVAPTRSIAFLAAQGARLDVKDVSNRTALDIALGVPPATVRNPFEYRGAYGNASTAAVLRQLMTGDAGADRALYEAGRRQGRG